MNHTQPLKSFVVVVATILASLILVALLGQAVSAQQPVDPLRRPFHFVKQPQANTANLSFPPAGSTVIVTQTFAASFAPTTTLSGTTPLWRVAVNDDDTAQYYWGATNSVGSVPVSYANSAWTAVKPITTATALTPGVSKYPNGQDTWLIYGPIDLSQFARAHLSFEYYLDSAQGDELKWGMSADGQTYYGNTQSGSINRWITETYSIQTNLTSKTMYLAFAFASQNNPQRGFGAFIRNVRLTAEPLQYGYLPVVFSNYTPPPPPGLYGYTFNLTDMTDLNTWGGSFTNSTSGYQGKCHYGQFERTNHGNPSGSLAIWNNCKFVNTAASPNVLAPADFRLVVQVSPWQLYGNDLYGVIFGASSDTFGPGQFNIGGQFYRLSLATNVANSVVTAILLERCNNGNCKPLTPGYAGLQGLPAGLVLGQSAYWDQLDIRRVGTNIQVFVNGQQVINLDDSSIPVGPSKFGVHIYPLDGNDTTNPPQGGQMELDFDNIQVYAMP